MRIEYLGETHTISEWARLLGISHQTIACRYKQGLGLDKVLNPKHARPGPIADSPSTLNITICNSIWVTIGDKTMNLHQWAEYQGIRYKTLINRVYVLGWSLEKAILTPVIRRKAVD